MTRAGIAAAAGAAVLLVGVLVLGYRALPPEPAPPSRPPTSPPPQAHPGLLYGRITTLGGDTYEGRLRWGVDQEASWGDYFNGTKEENPWVGHVPAEWLTESRPIKIFGIPIAQRERKRELGRQPFMVRFGDIARVDASVGQVRVTLKSGTVSDLDRQAASDFDDDLRVWDRSRGVVDLDSLRIRTIEFLPGDGPGVSLHRLHGTVRTGQGAFTGFLQWDREGSLGSDELEGRDADASIRLRFDTLRSIARRSADSSLVTLTDGREVVLSGGSHVGRHNRGIYVDDARYGRVLVSWDAFQRADFSPGGSGPAYGDFPPGVPLTGSVTTRDGRQIGGRLVWGIDESETTETLDAPAGGVDYTIPFGLVASVARDAPRARLILHTGEELRLELAGDLGDRNAGMLIFAEGGREPEFVPWADVARVDLDRPPAMYPPLAAAGS